MDDCADASNLVRASGDGEVCNCRNGAMFYLLCAIAGILGDKSLSKMEVSAIP